MMGNDILKFNIGSLYHKLLCLAVPCKDEKQEIILTAQEAEELLDYIDVMNWLTSGPLCKHLKDKIEKLK